MKNLSKNKKRYLLLNLLLLAGALIYPLYYYFVFHSETPLSHCLLKEWFGIYCPLCGGTRCVYELLHFRFLSALRYNAYVVFMAFLFLIWDVWALVRFLRAGDNFPKIPKWVFFALAGLLLLFFIGRNVLLLGYGIDPIGDLS